MKQNNLFKGASVARLLLLLALIVVGSVKSLAVDITAIELGKEYTQARFTTGYYSFTATNAGKYRVYYSKGSAYPYSDSNFTTQIDNDWSYVSNGQQRAFNLTSAGTYYVMVDNGLNGSEMTFMVEELASLDTTGVSPVPGTVYSITGTGQLSVKFNMGVTISEAYLTAGTTTKTLTRVNADGNTSVLFELKSVLHDILTSGVLKAGDEFSVTLNGICASDDANTKFGDSGSLTLKYKMPEMPTTLESKSVPSTFLSYWEKGNTAGILTLTFSDELSDSCGTAALSYGNLDNDAEGEYYYETLPVTINGKTLTVDFTDKVRTPATMTPQSDSIYSVITVKIGNVRNKANQLCYTESSGSMGSYTFQMPYSVLAAGEVTTQFTPASGEDLTNVDNIELYIAGEEALKYDGVNFNYTLDGAKKDSLIANDKITKTTEDDAVVLNIPVPTEVKTAKDVTVSLANLVCLDGVKRDISAKYNGFVLKLIHPATTSLDTIQVGDSLVVWTNKTSQIGNTWSMRFQIYDLNPTDEQDPCIQSMAYMHKAYNAETKDTCFVYNFDLIPLVFIKGHTYQMTFEAAASEADFRKNNYIGVDTILLTGLSKEFEYSLYNLVSIDPDPDSTVIESIDQRVFNLEFDGLVNINSSTAFIDNGFGDTSPLESIVPTDEGATADTKYSRKWQLTVSEGVMSTVKDVLPLSVAPVDELGLHVKGNEGKEAGTYFLFNYEATVGVPDVSITPANNSTVAKLDTIVAEYSEGLNLASVADSKVILYDKDGNEVAHGSNCEQYFPESEWDNWDYVPTQVYIYLNKTITEAGEYTLVIPSGYMILGQDMYNYNSKAMTLKYTVGNAATGIANLFTNGTTKYEVFNVAGVKVLSTTDKAKLNTLKSGMYIINGKKVVLLKK